MKAVDLSKEISLRRGPGKVLVFSSEGMDVDFPLIGQVQLGPMPSVLVKWSKEGTAYSGGDYDIHNTKDHAEAKLALTKRKGAAATVARYTSIAELRRFCADNGVDILATKKVTIREGEFITDEGKGNV
tara:strand:+ start:898 stop:1284 length:387 start_codon:yes stop_codon:yes gene_type:complete